MVRATTIRTGLATTYNNKITQIENFTQVPDQQNIVEACATQRTLDSSFAMIGEQAKHTRKDSAAVDSAIFNKVFGSAR